MAKQLLFEDHARARMLQGVDKLANAVAVTMGPTGRNVILDKSFGGPTVTKDGVTVAKEIELEDRFENMGSKLVVEVAQKTSDLAGDGTTTATVLARAIFREGLRNIVAGSNPMAIRRGIQRAVDAAVGHLYSMAKPVTSKEEVAQVGAISANNDKAIGQQLADALERVGKDGVITVEEGKKSETEVEFVDGMQFDKGYVSPYFINRTSDMDCVMEDCFLLIHEKKISSIRDMIPILEKVGQTGKPLLIIAEDVDGEALTLLVVNKLRGVLNVSWRISSCRSWAAPRKSRWTRAARPSSKAAASERRSRNASARSTSRSSRRTASTTRRSTRSGWPSCPAEWRWFRLAQIPKSR